MLQRGRRPLLHPPAASLFPTRRAAQASRPAAPATLVPHVTRRGHGSRHIPFPISHRSHLTSGLHRAGVHTPTLAPSRRFATPLAQSCISVTAVSPGSLRAQDVPAKGRADRHHRRSRHVWRVDSTGARTPRVRERRCARCACPAQRSECRQRPKQGASPRACFVPRSRHSRSQPRRSFAPPPAR